MEQDTNQQRHAQEHARLSIALKEEQNDNKKLVSINKKVGADRRKQVERIERTDLKIQNQANQIAQLHTDLRKASEANVSMNFLNKQLMARLPEA